MNDESEVTKMVDYKELLNEKLEAEYDAYVESLKQMPPEQIVENAYQKVFKEDLVLAVQDAHLEPKEAKALYLEKNTLDRLYQDWMDTDVSYMDLLRDCVDDSAKDAVKEMKARNKENER